MRVVPCRVGLRGVDSYPLSAGGTEEGFRALASHGIEFVVGYLGAMTAERLTALLSSGLGFMPVTFADRFDGARAVAQYEKLGLPEGVTTWLDVENVWEHAVNSQTVVLTVPETIARIDVWANTVKAKVGADPGLYVGSPQPLTSDELFQLTVDRYWDALSEERDRYGQLARPRCGFCMWQMSPSITWPGTDVLVDVNMVGQDFRGRVPNMVVA